jgi:hypothetical protein
LTTMGGVSTIRPMFVRNVSFAALTWLCLSLCAPRAFAKDDALVRFPTRLGQLGFQVHQGRLLAAFCRAGHCDFTTGVEVSVPADLLSRITRETFTRLELEQKRAVVRLVIPVEDRAWEALITAPFDLKSGPTVAFSGWTGLGVDDEGEQRGTRIEVFSLEGGLSQIVVGGLRGEVELCGRTTLIDPKVLYPNDLELHRIKLMRLPETERARAATLTPVSDESSVGTSVSRARVASSAKGSPAFLSDRNEKTVWTEDRGGDGRGEFVIFDTPELLPVTQVAWTFPADKAAVPTTFWIATDKSLFRVVMDPAQRVPGQRFRVELPAPETTSCVALVLDGAASSEGSIDVGLAEFEARAAVDAAAIAAMVTRLDQPETDADPIIRTLAALGKTSVEVLSARYPTMSVAGKARALTVYDSLPCEETARSYVAAIETASSDGHLAQRLERCGSVGEKAVLRALPKAEGERAVVLAQLLAKMSPSRAADRLVPLLAKGNRSRRAALRAAIGSIAAKPEAAAVLTRWLEDAELPEIAAIDLLRALGDQVTSYRAPATARLRALLSTEPSYRTRFLLVPPLSRLAAADPALVALLESFLTRDEEDAVRAEAARWFPTEPRLSRPLVQAADDPHVRVREAAIVNLSEHAVEPGRSVLLRRLAKDPWPFVRAASIKGLLVLAPSPAIDGALAESAGRDPAASVRRPALLALGTRNALAHLEVVRDRLGDDDEDPYVRAAAAATLGTLCDLESVEELDKLGRSITRLSDDEGAQVVGRAAVTALGRIAPSDLRERLSAFAGEEVPPWAKQVAEAAREHPEPCRRP